jgi:formylglycine-generating enzyme required for sulfatase activity
VLFCNWLSGQESLTPCYTVDDTMGADGKRRWEVSEIAGAAGYRLPTQVEWEYACRARSTARYSFGDDRDDLTHYGVYAGNCRPGPAPRRCGTLLPNGFGLFDMHGNVEEWCADRRQDRRLSLGGSYPRHAEGCASATAWPYAPGYALHLHGFRVARSSRELRANGG